MKKLNLFSLQLKADNLLDRNELKLIMGGYSGSPGTCAFNSGNGYSGIVGVNKQRAQSGAASNDSNWCCDSCCDVEWLSSSHKGYLGCAGHSEY